MAELVDFMKSALQINVMLENGQPVWQTLLWQVLSDFMLQKA
jgi:hypothetical protein